MRQVFKQAVMDGDIVSIEVTLALLSMSYSLCKLYSADWVHLCRVFPCFLLDVVLYCRQLACIQHSGFHSVWRWLCFSSWLCVPSLFQALHLVTVKAKHLFDISLWIQNFCIYREMSVQEFCSYSDELCPTILPWLCDRVLLRVCQWFLPPVDMHLKKNQQVCSSMLFLTTALDRLWFVGLDWFGWNVSSSESSQRPSDTGYNLV